MDLLELIDQYQSILKERGRGSAKEFLLSLGVHARTRIAIMACFDDDGKRLGTVRLVDADTPAELTFRMTDASDEEIQGLLEGLGRLGERVKVTIVGRVDQLDRMGLDRS